MHGLDLVFIILFLLVAALAVVRSEYRTPGTALLLFVLLLGVIVV